MEVKIYTLPTCQWCDKLKAWLKKHKVKFEEFDLADSQHGHFRDEVLEKSNQLAVPVIDINGTIIVGFHEKEISAALAKS